MPFKSEKQKEWMYKNKPEIAILFDKDTDENKPLPERSKKKKKLNYNKFDKTYK